MTEKNIVTRESLRINALVSGFIDSSLSSLEKLLQTAPDIEVLIIKGTKSILKQTHSHLMKLYNESMNQPIEPDIVSEGDVKSKPEGKSVSLDKKKKTANTAKSERKKAVEK